MNKKICIRIVKNYLNKTKEKLRCHKKKIIKILKKIILK